MRCSLCLCFDGGTVLHVCYFRREDIGSQSYKALGNSKHQQMLADMQPTDIAAIHSEERNIGIPQYSIVYGMDFGRVFADPLSGECRAALHARSEYIPAVGLTACMLQQSFTAANKARAATVSDC